MDKENPPKKPRKKKINPGSTATAVQIAKLIALTKARPHHTHELRQMGISHPAGRILNLRQLGFVFDVHKITTVDGDGFSHRGVALYELIAAPHATQ